MGLSRGFSRAFFLRRTCAWYHILNMKLLDSESPSDVARWLRSESTSLWPALLGSLSLRRSRCIRKDWPACRSGEQQQSYVSTIARTGVALPSTCQKSLCRTCELRMLQVRARLPSAG